MEQNKLENTLDCRIFNFKKWIIPKTKSYNDFNSTALSIGYFDFVDVEKLVLNGKNPLESYISYKNINEKEYYENFISPKYSHESDIGLDSTGQQLFVFTNIEDYENLSEAIYSKKKIDAFWEEPSLIRFYSLLHIKNGTKSKSVCEIINKIHSTFHSGNNIPNNYNAVCYFSLDYSDIIICAKNISISDFANSIFEINYNISPKCIRDSFSLIAVEHNAIKSLYDGLGDVINNDLSFEAIINEVKNILSSLEYNTEILSDEFTASFNIGVQNYNTFKNLIKVLKNHGIRYDKYKLLGRHDVAIYNSKANMFWIIVIQIIIDYFSKTTNKLSEASMLFNCEVYIRIPYKNSDSYSDEEIGSEKQTSTVTCYENAREILEEKIIKYTNKAVITDVCVKQIHITPIYTLRNSILGLLKNGFAEDFVLCIFKSFLDFLDYITEKVDIDHVYDTSFDNTFNSYFDIINSLINSAMHSDRQFIQSPSFNPVFFDIPPKLMAYYTATTNKIFEIINTNQNTSEFYSFIFRPSFNTHIEVVRYSYADTPPTNRLLEVKINEPDLYYPFSVISQICHEIAHFVGDENRKRELRKNVFVRCILYNLAYNFMEYNLTIDIDDEIIVGWIKNVMDYIINQPMYINSSGYSNDLERILYKTLIQINTTDQLNTITNNLFNSFTELSKTECIDYSAKFFHFLQKTIYVLIEKYEYSKDSINDRIYTLLSIFSEIYADLQMLLILDIKFEEYLSMFISMLPDNTDIRINDKNYYRILNIAILFILNGTWKIPDILDNDIPLYIDILKDINSYIKYIQLDNQIDSWSKLYNNNRISEVIEKLSSYEGSDWQGYNYWNMNIQLYLLQAYDSSKKSYENEEKREEIQLLRSSVKTLKDFDNAVDVFCNIQTTNEKYSNKLFLLTED